MQMMARIEQNVLHKAIATLRAKNIDYRGILYAGLMITPDGDFKVLEFNCRFGDPETQAILPLLETPLEDLLLACTTQRLSEQPHYLETWFLCLCRCYGWRISWSLPKGQVITGIESALALSPCVFQAGTKLEQQLVTDGGRVLGVTGIGETFEQAIALAYAALNCIHFEGMYYRRDIGHRVKTAVNFNC
jgi:phosphoribosylamine--glycine ligase